MGMATRLFLNISQSYIPFYIQDSLKVEDASMVARVPLVMFAASFVSSFPTKIANRYVGRASTWLLGAGVGLAASITVFLGHFPFFIFWVQFVFELHCIKNIFSIICYLKCDG